MATAHTRISLHQLVDSLFDHEFSAARRMREYLLVGDPVRWALDHAPEGESLSGDEELALVEAEAAVDRRAPG